MSPPIAIRPATRSDIPLILALIRELAEYERDPQAVVATKELLEQHLCGEGVGRGPVAECVIGELDGVASGFALFFHNFSTWLGRPGIYLEDLFVRPSDRGRGLGKALLQHLAALAVERGCGRLEWAVLDWNEPAIGFYKSMGAVPMGEWTIFRLTGAAMRNAAQYSHSGRPAASRRRAPRPSKKKAPRRGGIRRGTTPGDKPLRP